MRRVHKHLRRVDGVCAELGLQLLLRYGWDTNTCVASMGCALNCGFTTATAVRLGHTKERGSTGSIAHVQTSHNPESEY